MPDRSDLTPEAMDILIALAASEEEPGRRTPTDDDLLRFICKWCDHEEADEMVGAIAYDPKVRERYVALLDRVSVAGQLRLRSSDSHPAIRAFVRRAIDASLTAFSAMVLPAPRHLDPDASRVLTKVLRDVGSRLSAATGGYARVRGVDDGPVSELDEDGSLSIPDAGPGQPWFLIDPVLGNIPLALSTDLPGSIPGFAEDLGLEPGRPPQVRVSQEGGASGRAIWIRADGRDVLVPVVDGPRVEAKRLTIELDFPGQWEGAGVTVSLRAGTIDVELGTCSITSPTTTVALDLVEEMESAIPLAALRFEVRPSPP